MTDKTIQRRSFLKLAGAALAGMSLPFQSKTADAGISTDVVSAGKFWIDKGTAQEYFRQKVVNTKPVHTDNMIWAKVDGCWQKYQLAEYSEEFFDWFIEDTFKWYEIIFDKGETPPNGGHHTPGISTYSRRGIGRGDSRFHLNSAFKSVTIVPKKENIDYYVGTYKQYIDYQQGEASSPGEYSLDWKKSLLRNKDFWDRRMLVTTDLYSGQNAKTVDLSTGETDVEATFGYKESHYLLNTMENPMANILYLDSFTRNAAPTWEFRGIVANTHWNNPDTDEMTLLYQQYRQSVLYPHMIQHGRTANHIGVVFHIVEQFDNKDSDVPPGRGVRVVPPGFPYLSHAEYLFKKMVGKV
jgi:hypothetical protein